MTILDRAFGDEPGRALRAPPIASGDRDLDPMGHRFAQMTAGEAETLIDAYVVQAISEWRVTDATFWQRVKLRSRMIRATARYQPSLARA